MRPLRFLVTGAVAALWCCSLAATPAEYAGLAGSKALAVVPGEPGTFGIAEGEANDLAAALAALKTCEAHRLPGQAVCEIRRLNEETITSGEEIRADIPSGRHPLHLWRIDGPRATVYLAGSVHILKPSLYPLPEAYESAFAASDKLVVEVNLAAHDPLELQRKTLRYASLPAGVRLESALPAPLLARLETSLARYGVPLSQVATVKPNFLMNQLVLLRLATLGYQGEYGVEQHFLRKADGREVLELETIDQQLSLLFDQPDAVQIQLLSDTLDQEPMFETLISGMITAWLAGDDERFMQMFEAQAGDSPTSRRFTEALLDDRNTGMVSRVKAFLHGQGTYFVLVGAAHLIGDKGIVALLEADGIHAERAYAPVRQDHP
ncbi:MAG: TraB/GumN family protein [Pseudomonadales bacterium]|jgi:uncharacterized protein YbaP (TraB family)